MTDPDDIRNMAEHDDSDPAAPLHLRCAEAVEIVTDYLDDALSARDLVAFEAHLADCEGCTIFVDQIAMTIRLTSESGRSDVDVTPANFELLLTRVRIEDLVSVDVFRRDQLLRISIAAASPPRDRCYLGIEPDADDAVAQRRVGWLSI